MRGFTYGNYRWLLIETLDFLLRTRISLPSQSHQRQNKKSPQPLYVGLSDKSFGLGGMLPLGFKIFFF